MFVALTIEEVQAQRAALAAMVKHLDPASVPLSDAPGLWRAFNAIERLASSAKTLLADRVAESREWARNGHRSAAEALAAEAGTSVGEARAQLGTSEKLPNLAHTEEAIRQGKLSRAQAEAIADAASVNPAAEGDLIAKAGRSSLKELRDDCGRAKAAGDPDPDATHRRIHERRHVRTFTDSEGGWNIVGRGTAEDGARFEAALQPLIDRIFRDHHQNGDHEPREAYAFDALIEMADRSRNRGGEASGRDGEKPKTTPSHLLLLRVDLEAMRRGTVADDECCEITGIGPIPVRVARRLLGDSILKLVITKGVDVLHVTHLGRGPTAAQRVALLWASPGCTVEGCARTRVEIDHRIPWAETHHTRLDALDPLCGHHHALKSDHGWALVPGTGKRPIVPPDHHRHPDCVGRKNEPDDGHLVPP